MLSLWQIVRSPFCLLQKLERVVIVVAAGGCACCGPVAERVCARYNSVAVGIGARCDSVWEPEGQGRKKRHSPAGVG